MEYRIKIHGTEFDVYGWNRTPKDGTFSHSEDFRLILPERTCFLKVDWIYEHAYPVEVVHVKRTAAQARQEARRHLRAMDRIFGLDDGKRSEPEAPAGGWKAEEYDEVKFNTGHAHACTLAYMPHTVEEARIVQEKRREAEAAKAADDGTVIDFKPITSEEMYAIYKRQKLDPGEGLFMALAATNPEKALQEFADTIPLKRRQFFTEMLEHTLRTLLEQLEKHATHPRARKAMQDAIDCNRSWAKNNLAGTRPDDPENGVFHRYAELCDQYERRAAALLSPAATPGGSAGPAAAPEVIEHLAKSVDALHTKADAIHGHAAAAHVNTDELKAAVPAAIRTREDMIRDQRKEIARIKVMLSARLTDLFAVYQQIDREDMAIFCQFMKTGNQVRTAEAVSMLEQTLRARVGRWRTRGPAYARLYDLYAQQRDARAPLESQFHDNLAAPDKPMPAVDAAMLRDVAEIVADMNPQNLEAKREEILSKYLRDYAMT